ncbi:hypothetical protein ACPCUK_10360 [Streptomyces arboris]|uniref:hypothetical protein n=1 Tax=Streptomyces arboris TaxID=2600619 RepID=UPI003C30E2D6
MDAGLAAVLGAAAGALATTGAGLVAGWSAREQARITARSEHQRQRREPRHEVYKRFIDAASDMEHHTGPGSLLAEPVHDEELNIMEHYVDLLQTLAYKVKEAWIEVALVGPREVEAVASQIERCSQGLRDTASAVSRRSFHLGYSAGDLTPMLEGFITAAREALDDDGTARG